MIKKIGKILAILISFFLCFTFIMIILVITSKNLITRANLTNYIKEGNILNAKASYFLNIEDKEITLHDKIKEMAIEEEIPFDIVNDMLESDEINELLGEFFSQTINYALKNTNKPTLSDETINKMIDLAKDSYQKNINITLDEDLLIEYVQNYTDHLRVLMPDRLEMIGNSEFIVYFQELMQVNSWYLYAIMIGLIILITILTWSLSKPILYTAITMMISGVLFVILGSADGFLNPIFTLKLQGMEPIISPLITNLLTLWFKCGVLFSFTAIFLLVIYAVMMRVKKVK